jgi:Lon-like ATP-dependent protease
MPGKGGLQLTGKLGEVIRESAHISLSWVKSHAVELGITPSSTASSSSDVNGSSPATLDSRGGTFLDTRDIHVHMPEGSIGKEGPSAGTALVSAFVSLFTKTRINPDIGASLALAYSSLSSLPSSFPCSPGFPFPFISFSVF